MKAAAILVLAALGASGQPLVVHEWGTFTSVAGENGKPLEWASWLGAPDLPCFVDHLGAPNLKAAIPDLVRMETPVLYFYSTRPMTLSVHVGFPQGLITEWYPQASKVTPDLAKPLTNGLRSGSIEWNQVSLLPGANLEFPSTGGASRYYAARNTGSTPLRIGGQAEKMIFYRGVGGFEPRLGPSYRPDGKLEIRNAGTDPIPLAILFENHGGKIGYRTARLIQDSVTLDAPELNGDIGQLRNELTASLVESGLYQDEAAAMVETWHDSWFEEGSRVFYIVPRPQVDSILPLDVSPAPAQTERVFVGRVEVLSPATRQRLRDAASAGDTQALEQFGRFLGVFAQQLRLRSMAVQRAQAALGAGSAAGCIP